MFWFMDDERIVKLAVIINGEWSKKTGDTKRRHRLIESFCLFKGF